MSSFSLDDKKDQRRVLQALTQAKIQLKKLKGEMDPGKNKIAIISIGCRYPGGVRNTNGLWKLLENQTDATSLYPENRWGKNLFRNSNNGSKDKIHAKKGGFLKNIKKFDAKFFGIVSNSKVPVILKKRVPENSFISSLQELSFL